MTPAGGRPPPTPRPGPSCGPAPRSSPAGRWACSPTSASWRWPTDASAWVGRSLAEIAEARGTDVIDVLIDVVLVEKLTLFMVLPSLAPSLGRSDEGWRVRTSVWKDPRVMLGGSDAGAHVDLMCHANYPTVVLGEVVRDRGLLSLEEAVEMMTDRPARHYGLAPPGPGRAGVARRSRGLRPRPRSGASLRTSRPRPSRRWRAALMPPPRRRARLRRGPRGGPGRAGHRGETRDGPAIGSRHRHGVAGRRQAVAAPSMTSVVPLTVAASSEAR